MRMSTYAYSYIYIAYAVLFINFCIECIPPRAFLTNHMKLFISEALSCPAGVKCGAGLCKVDRLFPNISKCECNEGAMKTKDGKCLGK